MVQRRSTFSETQGGQRALDRCLDLFLERVQEDSFPSSFFGEVDFATLRAAAQRFLLIALGEPAMGLLPRFPGFSETHMDRWVVHLAQTLRQLGADDDAIDQATMNIECSRERCWEPTPTVPPQPAVPARGSMPRQ